MKIQINDKVQYSRSFLRSTGMFTGSIPFAKGIVTKIDKFGQMELATIDWKNPEIPRRVNVKNLNKVGHLEID